MESALASITYEKDLFFFLSIKHGSFVVAISPVTLTVLGFLWGIFKGFSLLASGQLAIL